MTTRIFSQTPPDKANELFEKLLATSDNATKTRERLLSDLRSALVRTVGEGEEDGPRDGLDADADHLRGEPEPEQRRADPEDDRPNSHQQDQSCFGERPERCGDHFEW